MVAFALPAFAATVSIQRAFGIDPDAQQAWRVSEWIATAASVGLLAALGGVAFFALLVERFDPLTAVVHSDSSLARSPGRMRHRSSRTPARSGYCASLFGQH